MNEEEKKAKGREWNRHKMKPDSEEERQPGPVAEDARGGWDGSRKAWGIIEIDGAGWGRNTETHPR